MTNENKNIKELVSDDVDRTAELEAPTWRNAAGERDDGAAESRSTTSDFSPSDLDDEDQDTAIENLQTEQPLDSFPSGFVRVIEIDTDNDTDPAPIRIRVHEQLLAPS